jgi:type VI secretion system secreted protein Hcp
MDTENRAIDVYIDLGSAVEGEGNAQGFEKKPQVNGWSISGNQTNSLGIGSGAGVGKFVGGNLLIDLKLGRHTPQVWRNCAIGTHFDKVVLTGLRAGGKQYKIFEIVLTTCFIVSHRMNGGPFELPDESFEISWEGIQVNYFTQNANGTPGGVVSGHWSKSKVASLA